MREPTPTTLLALLLVCGAAQASDWVSIGKSDNGAREYFADISSIGITDDIRRAWIKTKILPDKPFSLERLAFNCGKGTMRWEASTLYGIEISDPVGSFPTPWKPIPPDTTGSVIMQFVCAWKSK
jgi:hypothetical protein